MEFSQMYKGEIFAKTLEISKVCGNRLRIKDKLVYYGKNEIYIYCNNRFWKKLKSDCYTIKKNKSDKSSVIIFNKRVDKIKIISLIIKNKNTCDKTEKLIINQIIQKLKRKFLDIKLIELKPYIFLDRYTYLGVNTFLTKATPMIVDYNFKMPYNMILIYKKRELHK